MPLDRKADRTCQVLQKRYADDLSCKTPTVPRCRRAEIRPTVFYMPRVALNVTC
jgi:hypothetical protein